MTRSNDDRSTLTRPIADRILARAVELDSLRRDGISLDELRVAAAEAGIALSAFDDAAREIRSEVRAEAADTVLTGEPRVSLWHHLVSNALAVPICWLIIFAITRLGVLGPWQTMSASFVLASVVAAGVAHRLRARVVELFLLGTTAMQASELAIHLIFGIQSAQGKATHLAVMAAGVIGVVIGQFGWRRARSFATAPASHMVPDATSDAPVLRRPLLRSMVLQAGS